MHDLFSTVLNRFAQYVTINEHWMFNTKTIFKMYMT
jgi:hypothetical protein